MSEPVRSIECFGGPYDGGIVVVPLDTDFVDVEYTDRQGQLRLTGVYRYRVRERVMPDGGRGVMGEYVLTVKHGAML